MKFPSKELLDFAKYLNGLSFDEAIHNIMSINTGYVMSRDLSDETRRDVFIDDYLMGMKDHMYTMLERQDEVKEIVTLVKNMRSGQPANAPIDDDIA
jgi:hypothetical protein